MGRVLMSGEGCSSKMRLWSLISLACGDLPGCARVYKSFVHNLPHSLPKAKKPRIKGGPRKVFRVKERQVALLVRFIK